MTSLKFVLTLTAMLLGNFSSATTPAPLKPHCGAQLAHGHADVDLYSSRMDHTALAKAAWLGFAPPRAVVLDIGSGSGKPAYDLKRVMPFANVIGFDLDPLLVARAQKKYSLPGLEYRVGDARKPVMPQGSVHMISCSSTGHHLTSYGDPPFATAHVLDAFDAFAYMLADSGMVMHRDFVIPPGPHAVILELPHNDGKETGSYEELSTAAFFQHFVQRFRSSTHLTQGVPIHRLNDAKDGWHRYVLSHRDATEFLLRKDYRDTFEDEIKEAYLYGSREFFEDAFAKRGLRTVVSTPIWNPWIVENRFAGKYRWFDPKGEPLPHPPTNYIILGEKTPAGQGVRLEGAGPSVGGGSYVRTAVYRDRHSGNSFDVVSRPNRTTDLLPYAEENGRLFLYARQGFPRPVVNAPDASPNLTSARFAGYFVEPVSYATTSEEPLFVEMEKQLRLRGGLQPVEGVAAKTSPWRIYPSPGISDEMVEQIPVQVGLVHDLLRPETNYSGFSTSGTVRAFDVEQILRFNGVEAMSDYRLQLGAYDLMLAHRRPMPPWIGTPVLAVPNPNIPIEWTPVEAALTPGKLEQRFAASDVPFGGFLALRSAVFQELDAQGNVLHRGKRDYVLPKNSSSNVASVLPFAMVGNRVAVAIEPRHFASVQRHEGFSNLGVCPAWWLPRTVRDVPGARKFVADRLTEWTGVTEFRISDNGSFYAPSSGLSPELVYPMVVQLTPLALQKLPFHLVDLDELVKNRRRIRDGHLALSVLRLAHALGRPGFESKEE